MGATSVTGLPDWRASVGQPVPGTLFVPPPYRHRSPFGPDQVEVEDGAIDHLRRTIDEADPTTVAAIIGEPVSTGGPPVVPSPGYWRLIRDLCDEHGVLLIADEVVTGFGRTGAWFGLDHYGDQPDIVCLGKGIASGYLPLSAAVFADGVAEAFQDRLLPHGLTYSGHPVCCAAALATIAVIEEDGLVLQP